MRGRVAVALCALAALAVSCAAAASSSDAYTQPASFFNFSFSPAKLSRTDSTPVEVSLSGRYKGEGGSRVPAARELRFGFDKYLDFDFKGVPVCEDNSQYGPRRDRSGQCPDAVVGRGRLTVEVAFPELAPLTLTSRLVVWNVGAERGGAELVAYSFFPAPITGDLVIPMKLRRSDNGRLGWKLRAKVPKIAGGYGSITGYDLRLLKRATGASCRDGSLRARSEAAFVDGTRFSEGVIRTCSARPSRSSD